MAEEEKKKTTRKTTSRKTTPKKEVEKETNEEKKETTPKKAAKKTTVKKEEKKDVVVENKKEEVVAEKVATKKPRTKKAPVKEDAKVEEKKEETLVPAVVEESPKKEEPKVEEVKQEEVKVAPVPVEPKKEEKAPEQKVATPPVEVNDGISVFDGKFIQMLGWYIIGFILTVITLGLGAPFAKCFILDWQYKHTKINGKRLCFDGNGLQLLGNYIKWTFFTIITLGIYAIFIPVQWNKWVVKHTHYEGNKKPAMNYSLFDGTTWEYIGVSIVCGILKFFSLGLFKPFADNLLISWRVNHTTYDAQDMEFDGKGFQLLGNYIKWTFLTIITLGIYGFWVPIRMIAWEVKHTNEKGVSKHPYKPVLGLILPLIMCAAVFVLGIYGLAQVDSSTYRDIRDHIVDWAETLDKEADRYDLDKSFARRVADGVYSIVKRDTKITWDDRYRRYFEGAWYDKITDNYYGNDDDTVEIAFVDVDEYDEPILLMKDNNFLVFWLYGNKIESHYFSFKDEKTAGVYLVTNSKKHSELAFISDMSGSDYALWYLNDIVGYKNDSSVRGRDLETFNDKLEEKGLTRKTVDIRYFKVSLDDLDGFDDAVEYYEKHKNEEYETEVVIPEKKYKNEWLNEYSKYLKKNLTSSARVSIYNNTFSDNPIMIAIEGNKIHILAYDDGELSSTIYIGNVTVAGLRKENKAFDDLALLSVENGKRTYYFVEYLFTKKDPEKITITGKDTYKELNKLGYKEVRFITDSVTVTKDDLSKLETFDKNQ